MTGRGESEISLVAPVVPSLAGVDWPGSRLSPRGSVAPVFFRQESKMKWNGEIFDQMIGTLFVINSFLKVVWYVIAVIMFVIALFTQREVFALLALVAAMMKKD